MQDHSATERFAVNTLGMRQLHAERHPEQLIKELIQNAFDEEASACGVTIQEKNGATTVTVEDDGPGFSDIANAYTLMGETQKRQDPEKRGRFNLGDKEVISVAKWAAIETTGWTIEFPPEGGRRAKANERPRGTSVTVNMPWDSNQAQRLTDRLKLIRPPHAITYTVNGQTIARRPAIRTAKVNLPTIIQSEPGQPMRPTRRNTTIEITVPGLEEGWLYEMGIPIQATDLPYDVDVMQKVPMPPNRDTVSESYLKDIYSEVLNAMYNDMAGDDFSQTWVRSGVESTKITENAVKTTIKERYGDKVVTWSSNTDSNMKALDNGYQVLHPRNMSKPELKNMQQLGDLKSANEVFKNAVPDLLDPKWAVDISKDDEKKSFAAWVKGLGVYCRKTIKVVFIHNTNTNMAACCTMDTERPTMHFNTAHLVDEFFTGRGEEQLALVIHELGHSEMEGAMSHGPQWGQACSKIGAMIAIGMAQAGTGQTEENAQSREFPNT